MTKSQFHHTIRKWVRTEEACGSEALKHKPHSKEWTPEEKYELVSKVLAGSSGTGVAIAAGINSGQLYNWIKKYKKEDVDEVKNAGLMADIKTIFERNKQIYGVRRVYRELRNRGLFANHKKIQRLMRKMGLAGKRPKQKYHSYKGEVGKVAANIINRDFSTTAPFQKWTTDVTQFSLPCGICYLSPILDMNSNEVISYDLSLHPNLEQIKNMLDRSFDKFPETKGLIFHSDQGWQYQHESYRNTLQAHQIIQSMSRKGNCYDNSIMESFFGRLKNEMFYGHEHEFASFEDFSKAIDEYIDYYNNHRIQAKTKWMPPSVFRKASICETSY